MSRRNVSAAALVASLAMGIVPASGLAGADAPQRQNFWVRYDLRLWDAAGMADASNTVDRAAASGVTGLAITGLDTLWCAAEKYKSNVRAFRDHARSKGLELIPHGWSVGYATMANVDSSLVESTPVKDVRFVAKGGHAVPFLAADAGLVNGSLDDFDAKANTFRGWWADHPGTQAFVDTQVKHSGAASVRMEPSPEKDKYGHARFSQHVKLEPGRYYRFTAYMRAENVFPRYEALRMQVYMDKTDIGGGAVAAKEINGLEANEGWRKIVVDFFSGESKGANLYAGAWGAKQGKFWIDDITLEEIGVRELTARKTSPRSLRSAATGKIYAEGKDWTIGGKTPAGDIMMDLPAGTAIAEGEQLLFDGYIPSRSGPKLQISSCMSDPRLYECFRKSAEAIEAEIHPTKWFLSLDEVRNGGTCDLCAARKTDMAHILGECVQRQHEIIRSVNPKAEIYAWSDMFDPFHNAKEKCCGCKGTFVGIWDLIPRDIVLMLWWGKMLPKSYPFFTERGFKVMGSVCCDSKRDLDLILAPWKENLGGKPNVRGFMYTTWCRDFSALEGFRERLFDQDPR